MTGFRSALRLKTAERDSFFISILRSTLLVSLQRAIQFSGGLTRRRVQQGLSGVTRTLTNTHTWPVAVRRAKDAKGEPASEGWDEIGWVLHLLEDLTSPAHTRNDPHPPNIDGNPVEAVTRTPTVPGTAEGLVTFASPETFFDELQQWTRSNFFSNTLILRCRVQRRPRKTISIFMTQLADGSLTRACAIGCRRR